MLCDVMLCGDHQDVKPASGHVLWPEMAEYDDAHSTFVGEGTAQVQPPRSLDSRPQCHHL